jgi:hypothetical protein
MKKKKGKESVTGARACLTVRWDLRFFRKKKEGRQRGSRRADRQSMDTALSKAAGGLYTTYQLFAAISRLSGGKRRNVQLFSLSLFFCWSYEEYSVVPDQLILYRGYRKLPK